MKHFLLVAVFLSVFTAAVSGADRVLDTRVLVDRMNAMEDGPPVDSYDSNGDGKVDYLEKLDEDGRKVVEVLDFNHDGFMDDFYYFTDGIITLREIDSNFDNKIDIWVYIKEGKYIEKYERDLDFNGSIDQVKKFGDEE